MVTAFTRPPPDHTGMCLQNGRLILAERLGVGSSSTVWLVADRQPAFHAVKVLLPPSYLRLASGLEGTKNWDRVQERMFRREAKAHALVHDHPNIPTLHHFFIERGHRCFLFDLCEGGSLEDALDTPFFWKRDDRVKLVLSQLIDALQHCHNRGVAHRDITPEHVLFSGDLQRVYLTSFGLASKGDYSVNYRIGSKPYMSPECYGNEFLIEAYNPQTSDIWSLGILLLQMLAGQPPWRVACEDKDQLYTFYLQFRAALLYDALPITHGAAALLSRILEPDPAQRITLAELRRELEAVGPLTVTEEELAYAPKIARQSYRARVSGLGVPYRVPPRHADLYDPPSYSEHPPPLTRPPSYTDSDVPPYPSPGVPPYSLGSNTELAWDHPLPSTSSNHSATFPALSRTSPYFSPENPASRSSLCISFTPSPEPSKQPTRLASMMSFLTGSTR